jgi:transposase-like zinc ribbon protein
VYTIGTLAYDRARELGERVHWPDGLICPWCGARERVVPEVGDNGPRLRYECSACGSHGGYLRMDPGGRVGR